MKKTVIGIAAIVALTLTGCANTYPTEYRSVEELRDAFVKAGGECENWEQTNKVRLATESGTCSTSNVLSIYSSRNAVDEAVQVFKSLGAGGQSLLIGENWIINDPNVRNLDPAIGGTFLTTS